MIGSWLSSLEERGANPSVHEAKNSPIHLLDDAGDEIRACTAFDCFCYELSLEGRQYVLSSGIWYEVVQDFVLRINRSIKGLEKPRISLLAWDRTEGEADYNLRCGNKPGFLHFDVKNIRYGQKHSQFEFCDLFHPKTKTLLFAKIVSKSSGMSHLVEQVRRTSELLFSTDSGYRKELAKVFKKFHPNADREWLNNRPRNGDWSLCLVSLGRPAGDLPFFAKCSLVRLCRDLNEHGHSVYFVSV